MKRREQKIRAWAVVFWLFVWQAAAMLLRALYPHGALLLASPLSSLAKLISLAATKTFWQSVGTGIVDAAVAEKALPYCNIVCLTGADLLEALPGYLEVLYNASPAAVGGEMPDNSFYFA